MRHLTERHNLMKHSTFAWALGAVAAVGLGMAAEACSSSSSTPVTTTDGGHSSSSSGMTNSSGTGASQSSGTGGSSATSVSGGGSTGTCYGVATQTYPEDGGGMYCPFSAVGDGGKNAVCTHGEHCCETPESAGTPSTCVSGGATCPVPNSTDWNCEGTPDCNSGQVCCGAGKIMNQAAQPGCGSGGATLPPSIYVSGFIPGPTCAASCAGIGSGVPWQICSQTSECPSGQTCIPVKPKGNTIGACCTGSAGNWTCTYQAGSGQGNSSSAASSAASSGTGTSSAASSAASTGSKSSSGSGSSSA